MENAPEWYDRHCDREERREAFAQRVCVIVGVFIGAMLFGLLCALMKATFN